jgi:trigger factor
MQVQVEQQDAFIKKLSVTVESDRVSGAIDAAFKRVAQKARIPGFRKGKAPRHVLQMHYGSQIDFEVINQLVDQSLPIALAQEQIHAITTHSISPGELKKNANFSYTAEVEVQPDIELTKHEGLEVEKTDFSVSDEAISAELDRMANEQAEFAPIDDRDVIENGDMIVMDYEGFLGDEAFEGGKAEDAAVEVGGGTFLPQFSDGLLGAKVPGEHSFNMTFPEDYQAEHLAGQEVTFKTNLKELKARQVPTIDDEFAKDLGHDDLSALQTKVRTDLEHNAEHQQKEKEKELVLDALIAANPFDLAPAMVEDQLNRMMRNAEAQMQQMFGGMKLGAEELQGLRENARPNAERQVRGGLLLVEVSKAAKVEVNDEDIDKEIEHILSHAGRNAAMLEARFKEPQERNNIRFKCIEDKTIQWIVDHAVRVEPKAEESTAE